MSDCGCFSCTSQNRSRSSRVKMSAELEEAVEDGDLDLVNEILARGEGKNNGTD